MPRSALRAVCMLVLASALWGTAATGTKFCLREFDPVSLLAVQLAGAAAVLALVLLLRGYRPPPSWRLAIVLGVLEPAAAYLGQALGLDRTSASNAAVVSGLESTFVVMLAALFLRERPGRRAVVAVTVGLCGLLVLEQASWLSSVGWGDLLVASGMVCAAGYTIVARSYANEVDDADDVDALALTAHQFATAGVVIVPLAALAWATGSERPPTDVDATSWLAALAIGVVGFAGSFLLYNTAIALVDATTAAVLLNLIPGFGLVSAIAWLGEPLTGASIVGALLVTASVTLFTWPQRLPARHRDGELLVSNLVGTVAPPTCAPPRTRSLEDPHDPDRRSDLVGDASHRGVPGRTR